MANSGLTVASELQITELRRCGGVAETDRGIRHILHRQIEIRHVARLRLAGSGADDKRRPQPIHRLAPLQLLLRAGLELRAVFRLLRFLLLHRRAGLFIRRTEHRDGHGEYRSDCKSDCGEGRRHAATVEVLAEYGDEAAFERRLAGHREPAGLRPAGGREPRDDFEQMSRVGRRPHAAGQNQIVARSFTFHAKTPGGEPHQGIEPVQSTRDLRQQLSHRVATLDVGELVQQDGSQLLAAPMPRRCGKQQTRSKNAPDNGNRLVRVNQQGDRATDPELQTDGFKGRYDGIMSCFCGLP